MIVILCESHQDAKDSFDDFMGFLEAEMPWSIKTVFPHTNCVETDDDLRYIFVDYRLENEFDNVTPDIVDVDQFFGNLYEVYFQDDILYG